MAILESDFAAVVKTLRPKLIRSAIQWLRCSHDDAEDLIADVILTALSHLEEFDEKTGIEGLETWLSVMAHRTALRRARDDARHTGAVSIEEIRSTVVREVPAGAHELAEAICALPPDLGLVIVDWLEGYSNDDIARRLRLHRNTVSGRLEEAFARLRIKYPDADALEYVYALFAACSQVTIYRKPTASWMPWRDRHPPEQVFRPKRITTG